MPKCRSRIPSLVFSAVAARAWQAWWAQPQAPGGSGANGHPSPPAQQLAGWRQDSFTYVQCTSYRVGSGCLSVSSSRPYIRFDSLPGNNLTSTGRCSGPQDGEDLHPLYQEKCSHGPLVGIASNRPPPPTPSARISTYTLTSFLLFLLPVLQVDACLFCSFRWGQEAIPTKNHEAWTGVSFSPYLTGSYFPPRGLECGPV